MEENKIKVSVIMPVYKVEEYVGKAIESIQAQTLKDWEFLIVDEPTTGLDPEERVRIGICWWILRKAYGFVFHPRSRRYCGDVQQPSGHAKRDLSLYRNRAGSSEPCKRKDLDGGCLRRR